MPFDGISVNSIVNELNETIVGGKVEKIYQPEKDELIFHIRKERNSYRLLISVNPVLPRIHLTNEKKDNPLAAPTFCMLLRKHLTRSKIISIEQPSLERIIRIAFETIDEMGYYTEKILIVEIMGRHSNAILIESQDFKIIDSIKRVNKYMSRIRTVLPNIEYTYPPAKDKIDPLNVKEDFFCNDIQNLEKDIKAYKFFIKRYYGISPIVAQEICVNAELEPDYNLRTANKDTCLRLYKSFSDIFKRVRKSQYQPHIVMDNKNTYDFLSIPLKIYDVYEKKFYDSMSAVIETFYKDRDTKNRKRQKTSNLNKLVNSKLERSFKKLTIQQKELREARQCEYYRQCGDAIMSSLYMLEKGNSLCTLPFYEDESVETIDIKLDPCLTPIENAQKYYKKYNKLKNALNILGKQIIQTKDEIRYLESVLDNLNKCSNEKEISEIKVELSQEGYLKKIKNKNRKSKKPSNLSKSLHFISTSNFHIYVGKNNTQNDFLTQKFANTNDIWMHVKDSAGSHVIIKAENKTIDENTLKEAAYLAAFYSTARLSSNVPVDYTEKKNVRKPKGAKPGKVIYNNYKTIYITPDETIIEKLSVKK